MKKLVIQCVLIIILDLLVSMNPSRAQDFMVGGGAGIGDGYTYKHVRSGIPCLFLRGSYQFNDFLEGSSSITFFYPHKEYLTTQGGDRRTFLWNLDFDVHYIFADYKRQWSFYALAGLDINFLSSKYLGEEAFPNDYSDNHLGLNIGIGSGYLVSNRTRLFAEMKYTLGKFHQWSLSMGFLYNLEGVFKK